MKPIINPNFSVLMQLLISILLISSTLCVTDFCSVKKQSEIVAIMDNEKQIINLGDYIRGHNLQFTTDNDDSVVPWNPLSFIGSSPNPFDQGYKIINADVLETNDKRWFRQGIVFAQKDSKNIGISTAFYPGTKLKRQNATIQYYTLKSAANCFSAQIFDEDFNIAIDCQSVDGNEDIICYINTKASTISCTSIDSLNDVHNRKSQILSVGSQKYLITGTYTSEITSSQMTYLTLYHINQDYIDFVNIIDGYQLGLDHDILISDFDITNDGTILVNDLKSNQIHFVKYSLPNEIVKVKTWQLKDMVFQFQVTGANSLLIANGLNVMEYDLATLNPGFHYQLEKGDNQVINIQSSIYGVAIQTNKGFLYVYQTIIGSLDYLLAKVDINNKDYLLAPYANALYLFDEQKLYIHQISSGYLVLNNFQKSVNITVTGKSTQISCSFLLSVLKQVRKDKIIQKQNISSKHFKTSPQNVFSLNLDQIYSGSNLRYGVPASTDKISYNLEQLSTYKLNSNIVNAILTKVVGLDKTSFMLVGLTNTNVYVEKCTADDSILTINCATIYQTKFVVNYPPTLLAATQRKNGDIIIVWTYPQGVFDTLTYSAGKFQPMTVFAGTTYDYSSIVISEDKIFFVLKKFALIQVFLQLDSAFKIYQINTKNFVSSDPNMKGFYPRQVYLHPRNKDIFYVKFASSICLMTLVGMKPLTIECNQVLNKLIPDQQWDVVIGYQSYVVFTPNSISEYTTSGIIPSKLHDLQLDSDYTFPIQYSSLTSTIVMKSVNHKIIYYKLNKPIIDSIYFESDQSEYFSTQGLWTVSILNKVAYRQSISSKLTAKASLSGDDFKQDFYFKLSVSSLSDELVSQSQVTVINYPIQITQTNATNLIISLPYSSQSKQISIPIQDYFKGTIAQYTISCDYCSKEIKLETPFKNLIVNSQIIGASSIVQIDSQNVLILSNNRINIVDHQNKLQAYKVIQNVKKCTQAAWEKTIGLFVFCQDNDGQQIQLYSIVNDNITLKARYPLIEQALIKTANEISVVAIDTKSAYILIEDNDISNLKQKAQKNSNIKSFIWTSDSLAFKGLLTSLSFGLPVLQCLNDMSISQGYLFVTIGNIGIGYGKLSTGGSGVLDHTGLIDFSKSQQLSKYVLDDSIYQQVQVLQLDFKIKKLSLFVTSTTSLHMVINFSIDNDLITLLNVAELYNRYGTINTLNWQAINDKFVLLAYYNRDTSIETIAYYPRSQNKMINMLASYEMKIGQSELLDHSIFMTSQNNLFVSSPSTQKDSSVALVHVSPQFNLLLSYSTPGTFSQLSITANNIYTKVQTTLKVSFDSNDQNGIKWYTVVIIILLVLIVVGISYGMYLKMIRNRKDKKVSLLTEGQADQDV